MPYHDHPFRQTFRLVNDVLLHRCVPLLHVRDPIPQPTKVAPSTFRLMERLHFVCEPPGFRPALPQLRDQDKSTDEGRALRKRLNEATMKHVGNLLGTNPRYQIWSDASVAKPETPACVSAGYAALWDTHTDAILNEWSGSAGRLACSYTAEAFTARSGIKHFVPTLLQIPPSTLLCGFDNMGLALALSMGPNKATTQSLASIWSDLELLLTHGWTIAIAFFFSHVGTELNEHVDKGAAEALRRCTSQDHDQAPIDLDDMARAVQLYLTERWHESQKTLFRVAAFGPRPIDLTELASCKNSMEILRARANCSTHYGKLHRLYHPEVPLTCRLCGKLPAQGQAVRAAAAVAAAAPAQPPPNNAVPLPNAPAAAPAVAPAAPQRVQCPHCPVTLVDKAGLQRHLRGKHPDVAYQKQGEQFECECGKLFDSFNSRRTHRIWCWTYKETLAPANRAVARAVNEDIDTPETFAHFWRGECTGFRKGNAKLTIAAFSTYVDELLQQLAQ
jgi:hypothetical protein